MVIGKHEARGRALLANKWFEILEAPSKEMIVFEHSGHRPLFEEPAAFAEVMVRVLDNNDMGTAIRLDRLSLQGSLAYPAVAEPCR